MRYLFTIPEPCECGQRHELFLTGEADPHPQLGATYEFTCPVRNTRRTFTHGSVPGEDLLSGEYLEEGEEYPADAVPVRRAPA